jgi:hypothetical protein
MILQRHGTILSSYQSVGLLSSRCAVPQCLLSLSFATLQERSVAMHVDVPIRMRIGSRQGSDTCTYSTRLAYCMGSRYRYVS